MKGKILAINGSASRNSSNFSILKTISNWAETDFEFDIIEDLSILPPFQTALTERNTPNIIQDFRNKIKQADGIIICSPEYVFSIPSGLKNALEWCVSTTVLSDKIVGIITASASGEKGHEELQLIIRTLQGILNEETNLLIQGIKGKMNRDGTFTNIETANQVKAFYSVYKQRLQ